MSHNEAIRRARSDDGNDCAAVRISFSVTMVRIVAPALHFGKFVHYADERYRSRGGDG